MAPQDDLTAERAAFQLIWHISQELGLLKSFTVEDFEREDVYPLCRGHIIKALKTARQEALREAASKLGIGDSSGLLEAPCLWCGYNGRGYYQVGTHDKSCIWHTVGGRNERLDRLTSEGA